MSFNKFKIGEVVVISSESEELKEIYKSKAIIRTVNQNEVGSWSYSASVNADDGLLWCFEEGEMQSTGQYKKRSDFFTDETVKVLVDPDTGEGYLPEEE